MNLRVLGSSVRISAGLCERVRDILWPGGCRAQDAMVSG